MKGVSGTIAMFWNSSSGTLRAFSYSHSSRQAFIVKPGLRRYGIIDQLDNGGGANQGFPAPVFRDETKHFMLDFVPFTGSRREMRDVNFVSETL